MTNFAPTDFVCLTDAENIEYNALFTQLGSTQFLAILAMMMRESYNRRNYSNILIEEYIVKRSACSYNGDDSCGYRFSLDDYNSLTNDEKLFFNNFFIKLSDKQLNGVCSMIMTEAFNRRAVAEGFTGWRP